MRMLKSGWGPDRPDYDPPNVKSIIVAIFFAVLYVAAIAFAAWSA